ncbi:hypothetical protein D9C73_028378 [Collichthys lucidus]|uniref:Peptidase C76 domain-containing protein n=1 Tax=Collichthys lucidus TaxID=240159 RepID=A0A4U5TV51_COLLU|nr:hypothetical protein D9C73_028378 [Collichthys lucidus]
MPRKNKRSQAGKLRWQTFHEFLCASTTEQAECVGPQNSGEVKMSDTSNATVKQVCQLNASHVPQASYADIVKTGHLSDDQCVAGPSNVDYVNLREQPSEQYVCASRSQASVKYGKSRNQQCTCNSLTFLAFLNENENLNRADLDLVLDKGNFMYNQARKNFPKHIHLTTDELPDIVPSRTCIQYVDMTQLSRYGTFGDPLPGAVDSFLDLEAGLSCLLSDVQYALLLMRSLCIAVFRTMSGRFGFFDPHPRTVKGLPLPLGSRAPATAVMLTFTHLSDMIDRLIKHHKMLETHSSSNYELKPVAFVNSANLNNPILDKASPPTTHTAAVSTAVLDDDAQNKSSLSAQKMNNDDVSNSIAHEVSTDMETGPEPLSPFSFSLISLTSHDAPKSKSASITNAVVGDNVLHDISRKLLKIRKQERKKYKRRLMRSQKVSQRKENQKRKEKVKYASDETYKEMKRSYSYRKYSTEELRQSKQQYVTNQYRRNSELRQKKILHTTNRYRENVQFRQKRKQYITNRYRETLISGRGKNSTLPTDTEKTLISGRGSDLLSLNVMNMTKHSERDTDN